MKQLLLDLKSGEIQVDDVPIPIIKKGVIVENRYSLISAGTESSLIGLAEKSLIGKARERPDLAKKVINVAKKDGVLSAYNQAMSRLSKPEPLGYSCSGVVIETNVNEFRVGDRVACAGAGFANHAEYNYIPKNLCVKIPDNVSYKDACFTTVGAIAMQGVRNAGISIGETVAVIGLGLIGLLTVQILRAAGCKVLGLDIDEQKTKLALEMGANAASGNQYEKEQLSALSEFGADVVIITAATESNAPIELAGELVRDRGRVVIVGNVGMNVPRPKFYEKEAEIVVSRSCGLGRYDRSFEEKGIDYPIYVRWTERRNMQAFLALLSEKKINIEKFITHEFSIEDALKAYMLINNRYEKQIGVILKYEAKDQREANKIIIKKNLGRSTVGNIGLIGGGVHALSSLLPNLAKMNVNLRAVATATGSNAKSIADKYGFEYCTTDYRDLLNDTEIDTIVIAARNDLHAKLAIESLRAGKDVFIEKPMAINIEELKEVIKAHQEFNGKIMVGFNRRYSSLAKKLKEGFKNRNVPMIINYRVNAGYIPKSHWAHDEEQGSGMIVTECCHFVDFLQYIIGYKPIEVYARSIKSNGDLNINENCSMTISFEDGSIGTIIYTTLGDDSYPKELVEVFCNGAVGVIRDFRELALIKNGKEENEKKWLSQDKGFKEELCVLLNNKEDFQNYVYTTITTLKALESMKNNIPMKVELI